MIEGVTPQEAAVIAAAQASEAMVALLKFAREGRYSPRAAFEDDVAAKLAEALKLALEIDAPDPACTYLDEDEIAQLAALHATLTRFLEGWVG